MSEQGFLPFDGDTYDPALDGARLTRQSGRVFEVMRHGGWWTHGEIGEHVPGSLTGISARVRDFKKAKFGGYEVQKRHRGDPRDGLYEYRLIVGDRLVVPANEPAET